MTASPQPEGTMSLISKIINFLADLLDLILGKSTGDPKPNPDGGVGANTQESKVDTLHSKIDNTPTGVTTTDDGGISYDGFNAGKEAKK